jgi:hypothetical protein
VCFVKYYQGEIRKANKILITKLEGQRSLGLPVHRWENHTRVDHGRREWEDLEWIQLAQGRVQCRAVANTAKNFEFHRRRRIS